MVEILFEKRLRLAFDVFPNPLFPSPKGRLPRLLHAKVRLPRLLQNSITLSEEQRGSLITFIFRECNLWCLGSLAVEFNGGFVLLK
jgi:hypothetical protein